ncbi:unnamed protein product [Schistosoma rodhaini]|uniref:Major facilitator superfamily (MFS) profile domain-containing protein n=1 Tax=Schistosoma rodhaini TaxID=6188 RepID=A0AA85G0S0_9TREM|nr:unnamed protein product [Schistosoma rodhaini]CAH8599541.1 unnamed protein product [Schistosoma rodhaini]
MKTFWIKHQQTISINLVIFCFLIYKMAESLLQYGNRIYIYTNVCKGLISQLNGSFYQLCEYHVQDYKQYKTVGDDNPVSINSSVIDNVTDDLQKQNRINDLRNMNDSVESDIHSIQIDIQKLSGWYLLLYRLLANIPAMLTCLLYGLLMNRISQNYIMLIPCLGSILSCGLFLSSLLPNLKLLPDSIIFTLIGATIYGLCGKSNAISLCANSYIIQNTTIKKRTYIIGRLLGVNFFGLALGSLLLGIFYRYLNYFIMILFVIIGNLLVMIILFILIKNSKKCLLNTLSYSIEEVVNQFDRPHVKQKDLNHNDTTTTTSTTSNTTTTTNTNTTTNTTTTNNNNNNETSFANTFIYKEHKTYYQNIITYLLKLLLIIKSSYRFLFNKQSNNKHIYLLFILMTIFIKQISKSGEQDIILLYLLNQSNLLWNTELYAYYITCYYTLMFIQLIILLPIIEKKNLLNDFNLILIGLFTEMIRLLIIGLLNYNKLLIFLSAIIGSPACFIITCTKSIISKLINNDNNNNNELNKYFSIISILEIISNFIGSLLFTIIYNKSINYYSSLIFILDACLNIPIIIIFIWLKYKLNKYI